MDYNLLVKDYNLLEKIKIHGSKINMKIYIYKGKALPYSRKPTNKYGRNNGTSKSPFGKITIIYSGNKNHQWKLKLAGISLKKRIFS